MSYFENLGSQFDQFVSSIKERKTIYILPPISFLLSFLFIFTGFSSLFMSIIYMINISFFAFIVRDSYSVRKENILPLSITCISIILSAIQVIYTLDALATLAQLGDMFSYWKKKSTFNYPKFTFSWNKPNKLLPMIAVIIKTNVTMAKRALTSFMS